MHGKCSKTLIWGGLSRLQLRRSPHNDSPGNQHGEQRQRPSVPNYMALWLWAWFGIGDLPHGVGGVQGIYWLVGDGADYGGEEEGADVDVR